MTIFLKEDATPSIFNPNCSLKAIFSTNYNGSFVVLGPEDVKFKTFLFKNVKFYGKFRPICSDRNQFNLVLPHAVLQYFCIRFHSALNALKHTNSPLLYDTNCVILLTTCLACGFTIKMVDIVSWSFVVFFFLTCHFISFYVFISCNLY